MDGGGGRCLRLSLRDFAINRLAASDNTVHVPAAVPQKLSLDQMFVPLTALSAEQSRISSWYPSYRMEIVNIARSYLLPVEAGQPLPR